MTLTLNLTPEEEARLKETAAQKGLATEEYVLEAVKDLLAAKDSHQKVTALRTLLEEDEAEQRETGEYLLRVLYEDRLSDRKLFR